MFCKLLRIGRDSELRFTPSGTAVCNVVGAYDVGFGDKKHTQWIEGAIWGKQAEAVAQYILKGSQLVIYADDVEVEQFTKNDGAPGCKLKCRVNKIDFAGPKPDSAGSAPANQQAQQPQQQSYQQPQQQAPNGGFNDFDESSGIPF